MGQDNCKPQPGDLIEIDRPRHKHWALYMGDGYVIHVKGSRECLFDRFTSFLRRPDKNAPSLSGCNGRIRPRKAEVMKEHVFMLLRNDEWRVNNKYDSSYTPRPVEDIIWSAEQWINKKVIYPVLTSNCEQFVTILRYGKGLSEQSRTSAGCEIPIRDVTDEKHCPKPGDLIEIKKGSYVQWALYVGDGYVIHMTPVDENAAPLSASSVTIPIQKVRATKELLKEVVGNDDWAVNNNYDLDHTPMPVEEIIRRAEYCIDMELTYDELGIYSEDFVTDLRYGLLRSAVPLRNTMSGISSFKMTKSMFGRPSPGDLIEIFRLVYQHWALYMCNGYVIHVAPEGENTSSMSVSTGAITAMTVKVKKQLLTVVAGNDKWRVNNKYDLHLTPFLVEDIIRRAEQQIDNMWIYNLFHRNCEHFVTGLRYGVRVSEQVRDVISGCSTRKRTLVEDFL